MEEALILGERITYRVLDGDPEATPLVGIHGLGSDHTDLLDVVRRVNGRRVLLDLPGFGRSEQRNRPYPVARAVDAVLTLLDRLGVYRPTWLGCSYGGHVALRAALDAPQSVASLILVSPGGLDPNPPAGLELAYSEAVLRARTPAQVAASCDALAGRPNAATRRFTARRVLAHVQGEAGYRVIARSARGALRDDVARRLEEITAAVAILCGTRDPLITPAVARAAAERLPQGEVTILEGVGHMPWLEVPETVAAHVRRATPTHPCLTPNP